MAEIKEEVTHLHHLIQQQPQSSTTAAAEDSKNRQRLASLDVFRGLTVAIEVFCVKGTCLMCGCYVIGFILCIRTAQLMILVDDAGGDWPVIGHAPWNGCNLADFVMPFFLFIVGVAVALSLKRIPNRTVAIKRIVLRTLKLLFWGILLQGGYSHAPDGLSYGVDVRKIRWCGILQRIALAYLVVALLEILTKTVRPVEMPLGHFSLFKQYFWHWLAGVGVLVIYLSTLYGTYVPDWHFADNDGIVVTIACGTRGKLDPPCNAVGYVDRQMLGINHMYPHPAWKRTKDCTADSPYEGPFRVDAPPWCRAPFEPEGILSSISSILSAVIGLHFGHVLIHVKADLDRLKHWVVMGLALLVLGLTLHFTHAVPLNKQLYTISYVCVTSGTAALVFSALYVQVDMLNVRILFLPLEWIGMNAMLVYVMAAEGIFAGFINGWYYKEPHNTLIHWIQKHIFVQVWHSRKVGILLYVIFAEIVFWAVVSGIFHKLGIYWKL